MDCVNQCAAWAVSNNLSRALYLLGLNQGEFYLLPCELALVCQLESCTALDYCTLSQKTTRQQPLHLSALLYPQATLRRQLAAYAKRILCLTLIYFMQWEDKGGLQSYKDK